VLLGAEDVSQPATYDLMFVAAHHPYRYKQLSIAWPLYVDRRIAPKKLLDYGLR
jgi:hypothetical protein